MRPLLSLLLVLCGAAAVVVAVPSCTATPDTRPLPDNLSFAPQAACGSLCVHDAAVFALCHRGTDQHAKFTELCIANLSDVLCHLANHYDGLPNQVVNNISCDCGCSCTDLVPPPCSLAICHVESGAFIPMEIDCDALDDHLAHGDALPNSIIFGNIYLDSTCTVTNLTLCNGTVCPPPRPVCDCADGDASCLPLNCSAACPNGGACDASTHECVCDACDSVTCAPVPSCACQPGDPSCLPVDCAALCAPLDAMCIAASGTCVCEQPPCANATSNCTERRACNCAPDDPLCVPLNCTLQCPNGGACNADTGACECNACANATEACKIAICHLPLGNTSNWQLVNVSCSALSAHLGHGDFYPNSVVNGTRYDGACRATNETCVNGTVLYCECEGDAELCSSPLCDAQCPNGGVCDATLHACRCAGCDVCPPDANDTSVCNATLCCAQGPAAVACGQLPGALASGACVAPGTVVNGSVLGADCLPVPSETCVNGTVPPACDCADGDPTCTLANCTAQCPNGGTCDPATRACVCDACANATAPCKVEMCHFPPGSTSNAQLVNVSCSALPTHLAHGDVLPNSTVNGTLYARDCTAAPVICVNGTGANLTCINTTTPPALCDCAPGDSCLPLDCSAACPNGGACNATTHACDCAPCGPPDTSNCTVAMCVPYGPFDDLVPYPVPCSDVDEALANGAVFAGTVVNGSVLDASCMTVPNVTCSNSTCHNSTQPPPPLCDCAQGDTSCIPVDCGELCPNGGTCDADTHTCVCNDCTSGNATVCNMAVCLPVQGGYALGTAACAQLPVLLGHGAALPNTTVNETLSLDGACAPRSVTCVPSGDNVTCINTTLPHCGNGLVEPGEECDSGLHCTGNCTLPRPVRYCTRLRCTLPPNGTAPDAAAWLLEHCVCAAAAAPPDNLENPCGGNDQFFDNVVCATQGFHTPRAWGVFWFAFLVLAALVLVTLGAAAR